MTIREKITKWVEKNVGVGKTVIHSPNDFWNMYHSKSVVAWGWSEPLDFNGYKIVYFSFSPIKTGEKGAILFDYITEKKYEKELEKIDSK